MVATRRNRTAGKAKKDGKPSPDSSETTPHSAEEATPAPAQRTHLLTAATGDDKIAPPASQNEQAEAEDKSPPPASQGQDEQAEAEIKSPPPASQRQDEQADAEDKSPPPASQRQAEGEAEKGEAAPKEVAPVGEAGDPIFEATVLAATPSGSRPTQDAALQMFRPAAARGDEEARDPITLVRPEGDAVLEAADAGCSLRQLAARVERMEAREDGGHAALSALTAIAATLSNIEKHLLSLHRPPSTPPEVAARLSAIEALVSRGGSRGQGPRDECITEGQRQRAREMRDAALKKRSLVGLQLQPPPTVPLSHGQPTTGVATMPPPPSPAPQMAQEPSYMPPMVLSGQSMEAQEHREHVAGVLPSTDAAHSVFKRPRQN